MRRAVHSTLAAFAAALAVCTATVANAQDPSVPGSIPKYDRPLVIPPAMPVTNTPVVPGVGPIDYYEIAVRQLSQQILPGGYPQTTVWSYGSVNHPGTLNYPAFTIEARFARPVRVKWINGLVDEDGAPLPHLLPVDQTLHWANPPGGIEERDMRPSTPVVEPYLGPVPMVPHLHGGHNAQESDGYAEAWFLPAAAYSDEEFEDFAKEGRWYAPFKAIFEGKYGVEWEPGTATFQYENDQRAGTFWYHDHTLGMTRVNVYAGPAGFYLLRRGPGDLPAGLPGPAATVGSDPFGRFYEIPIAIQDRSFNSDGSLFYPATRAFFDGFTQPYIPDSDVSPIWNPEFFGTTMVVNGRTWPYLEVEPRRYRFRFLNGCNSRFLILKIAADALEERPAQPALHFVQIGGEGGFLPAPVVLDQLLLGLAERADVVVDFTGLEPGTELFLINEAPDEPFGGGRVVDDFDPADPETTGQVMKFRVVELQGRDGSLPVDRIKLPAAPPLPPATVTRRLSLNELESTMGGEGPIAALLGTMEGADPVPLSWDDEVTELPRLGATEIWEMSNFTADAHPIHIHEVQFQVVDRQPFGGATRPPEPWETGYKDTVIAYPGEITRVKAKFDLPGLYVWHCHIVEHEDNEMMRPYCVGECPALE
jgi:spore coat protein A